MKKIIQVPLSETGPLAEALRKGDVVELIDGNERVATVIRCLTAEEQSASEQRIQEMIEAEVLHRSGVINDAEYSARRPPGLTMSEDLIAMRRVP